MEDQNKFSLKGVIQKLKEYVENYTDLAYLKFVKRFSKIIPGVAVSIISLLFVFFVVFYLSMALAFFIGEWLHSYALGFAMTGVLFIFFILIIALLKNPIKKFITNLCVRIFMSLHNDDDDDEE